VLFLFRKGERLMDELVKKIEQILDQFYREELGNRLSQFSMISLKEMILNELRNYKLKGDDQDDKN
jgi:hypothetical protein